MSSNFYASYSSGMGGSSGGSGTVTNVSVVSANGFAGTVANPSTTPAITIQTTVSGILKGDGTAVSAATLGNLSDIGTDGITIGNGVNAVLGSGTTISQQVADTTHNGYLSSTDWNTFNGKQPTITTGNLTDAGTDGIVITGGTGAVIGSGTSIAQTKADTSHNGYLSSLDWNSFNGKQSSLTFGNLTDAGTDGITVTGGTGSVIGSGTSISQHVADTTHNGYLASADWNTFNGKGSGSVTSVSSTGATGLTLTTTNATTTPAIALGGTLTIAGGGTGQVSAAAAYNALSPMTTKGDMEYDSAAGTAARLAIGTTGQVLAVASAVPTWTTGLPGQTGGSAIAAGTVGELITTGSPLSSNYTGSNTANTYTQITGSGITLTAGVWNLFAAIPLFFSVSAGVNTVAAIGIAQIYNNTTSTALVTTTGGWANVSNGSTVACLALSAPVTVTTSSVFALQFAWVPNSGTPTVTTLIAAGAGSPISFYARRVA